MPLRKGARLTSGRKSRPPRVGAKSGVIAPRQIASCCAASSMRRPFMSGCQGEEVRTYLVTPDNALRVLRLPAYRPGCNADEAI